MKKKVLLTLASVMMMSSFGLVSCGESDRKVNEQESSTQTITVKTFTVDEIEDCLYGSEINFQKYVHITTSSSTAIIELKVESLTPDTLTIDSNNPNVGLVTGAGLCQAKVSALGEERTVSFNSYATVSSIKVKQSPSEILEGETLNLDDYVTVNVASPSGALGYYIAKSKTPEVVEIERDGKTLNFVGSGSFLIEIKDFSGKRNAYFTGKVISKLQKKVQVFSKTIRSNYTVYSMDANTNDITTYFPTYHTENYFAYPYGFQLSNWSEKEKGMMYWGMMKFPSGNIYEYTCGYVTGKGVPSIDTLNVGALQREDVANYFGFNSLDSSIFEQFESHKENGIEDYIYADYSSTIANVLVGDVLGISIPSTYAKTFTATVDDFNGKDSLYITMLDENEMIVNKYVITEIGTTNYVPLQEFVSNLNNEKEKISTIEIQNIFKNIIKANNYTITSKTYIANDATGVPYSFDEAIAIYPPLHTLYYVGTAKYTSEAMMINNTELFQGFEGLQDKTKAEGYIEKDNTVLPVTYDSDNSKFVLGKTPITDKYGQKYTDYEDYFATLASVKLENLDEFIILDYDEENKVYTFSIGKNSKVGSDNLRALTGFVNPDMSTQMFPTNLSGNEFEAGFAGQGTITLNEDGGYSFTYYSSRIASSTSGGTIEFRICIEYTVSNIGTTVIDEYKDL